METEYFFLIEEHLDVQVKGEDKNLYLPHEFKICDDQPTLALTYEAACHFYHERLLGLENGQFFLDFASPGEYVKGRHARFSITLYLMIDESSYYSPSFGAMQSNRTKLPLLGEEPEEMEEGNELLQTLFTEEKSL